MQSVSDWINTFRVDSEVIHRWHLYPGLIVPSCCCSSFELGRYSSPGQFDMTSFCDIVSSLLFRDFQELIPMQLSMTVAPFRHEFPRFHLASLNIYHWVSPETLKPVRSLFLVLDPGLSAVQQGYFRGQSAHRRYCKVVAKLQPTT
jgi:hypothetical protein